MLFRSPDALGARSSTGRRDAVAAVAELVAARRWQVRIEVEAAAGLEVGGEFLLDATGFGPFDRLRAWQQALTGGLPVAGGDVLQETEERGAHEPAEGVGVLERQLDALAQAYPAIAEALYQCREYGKPSVRIQGYTRGRTLRG